MPLLVKILGIVLIALAILFLIRPKTIKQLLEFFMEGKIIYFGGVIRLIIGVFFLLAASECKFPTIMIVLGILMLASGILIFLLGLERSRSFVRVVSEKSELVHRVLALAPLIIGILLVYAA